ncbi:phosphotransferase [Arthrobacter sp. SDTb3-6]|uniref:phosphotransferase n=1 Tax=Arthrobacter sp. SDTb3-6 TaxID=2713571 RepID=UPI00159DC3F0|nr:phosphotransferase [Arthrobacter sp. SDTb3-6]NVM97626.1 phosphotransferase [Arthrobacter sp. SDTb3-6]
MTGRIGWAGLPAQVRAGIEGILGDAVVAAASQPGGFSPGSADRVRLASGRTAFVKAVSADVNTTSAALHRREAGIAAALPDGLPVPAFLGSYDDGTWVALAFTDVDGRHPAEPWVDAELQHVLDTLDRMGRVSLQGSPALPRCEDSLRGAFQGWEKLRKRPLDGLDPWASDSLDTLAGLAQRGLAAVAGTSLVHGDLRTDNILLTGDGAVLVDWPWACTGAPWVDALGVLVNVTSLDPAANPELPLVHHPVFAGVPAGDVDGVLAGYAGYFMDMSRRPEPPGIPALRAFQRKQAEALIAWLRQRLPHTDALTGT